MASLDWRRRDCFSMGRVDSHRRRMTETKAILAVTTLESEKATGHDSSWPSATKEMTPEFTEPEPPLSRDAPMKSHRGQSSAVLYSRTSTCVSRSLSLKSTVRERCQHHKMAAAKTPWCSRLPCGPGCATRKLHGPAWQREASLLCRLWATSELPSYQAQTRARCS